MKETRPADFILRFCIDVVHLDSLHFGLWEDHYPRTIEGLKAAQENYTAALIARMPHGTCRILDVGCGTGELSEKLIELGYDVTAITPDPYLAPIVQRRLRGRGTFVLSKFEEYRSDTKYDAIVMSESSQYLNHGLMFPKVRELLAPDGILVVSDYFRKSATTYYETVWTNAEFASKSVQNDLEIVSSEDITRRTSPTLDIGGTCFSEIMLPTIEILRDLLLLVTPTFVAKIVTWFLRKQLALVRAFLYEKQPAQFDSARFEEHVEYKMMVMKCRTEVAALPKAAVAVL